MIQRRLARMAGQVRGLQAMIDAGRDPVDILTQVAAVRAAVDAMGIAIVEEQLAEALSSVENPSEATRERANRASAALKRFIR